MEIRDKKILVFGLAESGVGASNLLAGLGAKVTVTDSKPKEALMKYVEKLLPSVRLSLGGHPDGILQGVNMIVISPGVPLDIAPLRKAKEMGIRIIGELELAYQITQGLGVRGQGLAKETTPIPNPQSPIPFLAITGTNGKSTTTTLVNEMLNKGGSRTILGGNIGNALTEEMFGLVRSQKTDDDFLITLNSQLSTLNYVVAEVSSFQLETIEMFRPAGASILNITPDHMDRYHSMEKYKDAKARVFANQGEGDFLVLNADDPETLKVRSEKLEVKSERPETFYFSRKKRVEGIYFKDGVMYSNFNSSLFTLN
ncbi:MAG: Mur ligase family protein, partial [Thermodesulfovibrionales bacterium]|nr:Mur ligase family protein [Thermodesulfovibrionales bacterium]